MLRRVLPATRWKQQPYCVSAVSSVASVYCTNAPQAAQHCVNCLLTTVFLGACRVLKQVHCYTWHELSSAKLHGPIEACVVCACACEMHVHVVHMQVMVIMECTIGLCGTCLMYVSCSPSYVDFGISYCRFEILGSVIGFR